MKCAIYCRVSTSGQADNYSVSTQLSRGLLFATNNGLDPQIYQEVESASTITDRPKLEEMLMDIDKKIIDKVWVIESSRLSRDLNDAIKIQKIFTKNNVTFYVNDILTDFSSAEKLLSYHIQSAVSQYERSKIIERSIRGRNEWTNTGNMVVARIYGYKSIYDIEGKKSIIINENEAEIIRLIFTLFTTQDLPFNKIMKILNDKEYKTKLGREWHRTQIKKILEQSLYIGKSWNTEGKEIESKVYPPIIEEEIFRKAQILVAGGKKRDYFRTRKAAHELTGLITCGVCGTKYYYSSTNVGGKRWERYYHLRESDLHRNCKNTIKYCNKQNIDLQIQNVVREEFFENSDKYEKWYTSFKIKHNMESKQIDELCDGIRKQITATEIKKQNLVSSIADGVIDGNDAKVKMMELNEKVSELKARLKSYKETIKGEENDELFSSILNLTFDIDTYTPQKKRRLYSNVFKSIVVNGNRLTITMYDGSVKKMLLNNARR